MTNKKIISYEGWLNEEKLVNTLTEVVKEINAKLLPCGFNKTASKYKEGTQIKLLDSKSKYDFGFSYNKKKNLVEFDGNYQGVGHYNNSEICYKDDLKNDLAKKQGYEIVRFPFWLQLDNETFEHLFGFNPSCEIKNKFPHGFITNSSLNPASFCPLGLKRFEDELNKLLEKIKFEILVSLKVKSDRLNIPIKYVWENELLNKINSIQNYGELYNKIKYFADDFNK